MNKYKECILEKVAKSIADMNFRDGYNHIQRETKSAKRENVKNAFKGIGKGIAVGAGLGALAGGKLEVNSLKRMNRAGIALPLPAARGKITEGMKGGAMLGGSLGSYIGAIPSGFKANNSNMKEVTKSTKNYLRQNGVTDEQIDNYIGSRKGLNALSGKQLSAADVDRIKKKIEKGEL